LTPPRIAGKQGTDAAGARPTSVMHPMDETPTAKPASNGLLARLPHEPALPLTIARLAAQEGRTPAVEVTAAAAAVAAEVARASPAEKCEELTALLLSESAPVGLEWLRETGILKRILPEIDATVNLSQEAGRRHKDVWEHTKQVVAQSPSRAPLRWAALLHDIGKVRTRAFTPDGRVHFHGHAEVGARLFEDVARRFGFPRDLREEVRFLILHHLRANQYLGSWTDSAVRRFDRELRPWLEDLLDLSRADITSRRPGRRQEALGQIDLLWARIIAIRELDARVPPLPSGLGNAIMERFAIPPSRRIGELRSLCEEAIDRGELEERRAPEYYLDYLARVLSSPGSVGGPAAGPAP
jgi:poly(A) polymerase